MRHVEDVRRAERICIRYLCGPSACQWLYVVQTHSGAEHVVGSDARAGRNSVRWHVEVHSIIEYHNA